MTLTNHVSNSQFVNVSETQIETLKTIINFSSPENRPAIWHFRDLITVPGRMGLYDGSGWRVESSCRFFVTNSDLMVPNSRIKFDRKLEAEQPRSIDLGAVTALYGEFDVEEAPSLYLGGFSQHYGHWLTDYASRLWAANEIESVPNRFMMFWGGGGGRRRPDPVLQPYIVPFLKNAGIEDLNLGRFHRPILFRDVRIPEPAFQLNNLIFQNADRPHLEVAEQQLAKAQNNYAGARIYMSRLHVNSQLRDIAEESAIEALFESAGFTILSPEHLELCDQISLFNSADIIAGLSGSAFHTGMFSFPSFKGTLLVVCGDEAINSRLILQASIKNYRSIFVRGYTYRNTKDKSVKPILEPDIEMLRSGLEHLNIL